MAKIVGYQVIAIKPVCVDFLDGRAVSFQPGMRFEAHPTNASVRRLLRTREVRQLGAFEQVPALPEKLGAPADLRAALAARKALKLKKQQADLKRARLSAASTDLSKAKPVDLSALNKPAPSAPTDDSPRKKSTRRSTSGDE